MLKWNKLWYNFYMRIFSWLKGLFNKDINISKVDKSNLIACAKSGSKIKFGTSLDVEEGFVAVLCHKNKVGDLFTPGRYRLDVPNMPILNRLEKLTKPNKKGELPKVFSADIYYINLANFDNQYFFGSKVRIKDNKYKNLSATLSGKFSYQISSPIDFLEALFTQFGIVKNSIAIDELSGWVSNLVEKKVQKNAPSVYELYCRDTNCFEGLIEYINKNLNDVGVKLQNIEITEVKFPKRIYEKVKLSATEIVEQRNTIKVETQLKENTNIEISENSQLTNATPQSNSIQTEQNQQDFLVENNNERGAPSLDTASQNNNKDGIEIESQNEVSLNGFEEPIEKTIEYKKCLHCGALNHKDSKICFQCHADIKWDSVSLLTVLQRLWRRYPLDIFSLNIIAINQNNLRLSILCLQFLNAWIIIATQRNRGYMEKIQITKDMTLSEVMSYRQNAFQVFLGFGMHCFSCPVSQMETVEEAAMVHDCDLNLLLEKLNEVD